MMDRRSATRRFLVERMVVRENGKSGALHRVVHVDDECNRVWLFDLSEMTWPEPFDRDELLNGFETSPPLYAIEYEEPYPAHLAQDEDLSASGKVHDRNWDIVEHLLGGDRGKALLEKRSRKERIDATIVAKETTRQTVVALLRRFWERGLSRAALRPDYANCGGPGKSRSIASGAKVGRPRTISPGVGSSVNDDMRRIFHIGADYYLRLKKPSQQAALNYIVNIFYSDRSNEAGKIKIHLEDGRPTLKQFSHFLRTFYPENVRFKARHGQKKFDLEGRALTGRADQNAKGPGDEFQIDATIADVYLRSQFDRRRIVGRPVIYCAIDVWSRLITGIYVGFEGPSWIGAMMVLTNMVTPKVEFCRQYGIEIDPDEWPAHHAPRSILADRGELLSVRLGHRIVDTLHINIGNTTAGRGDLKSIVESRFRLLPALFKQFTPGYVEPDFGTRGARDYRLESALDLEEFTQMIIRAVLRHNRAKIGGIETPTQMTTDGMPATPLSRWTWGIENRSGSLHTLRPDDVALNVMPRDKAFVTKHGIRFRRGYYECEKAVGHDWFGKAARKGKGFEVEVAYDPRSLDILYLLDPRLPRGFEPCRLLDPYKELAGKSLFEFEEKELGAKRLAAVDAEQEQAKAIETEEAMRAIEQKAIAKTKAVLDPDATIASQVADIRSNGLVEKEFQRPIESFNLASAATLAPLVPESVLPPEDDEPDTYKADMLAMLEKAEAANNQSKK